jgi:AcrR family transcriptional regulator
MGRPITHDTDAILDAARTVLFTQGAGAVTIKEIAGASGAPVGSLYHRFGSRDDLVARLWMRAVRRSQELALVPMRAPGDPVAAAVATALSIFDFAIDHPADARLLTALRREDLAAAPRDPDVLHELATLNDPLLEALRALAHRLYGDRRRPAVDRTALGCFDLPYGAIRRPLVAGQTPSARLRAPLARAVRAALADDQEPAR